MSPSPATRPTPGTAQRPGEPADPPDEPESERRFTLELCGNKAGYEVTPEAKLDLDLDDAQARLEAAGVTVLTNAGLLLVAQLGPVEVSLFESGRLLLKTKDGELAERATVATYDIVGVEL